VDSSRGRVGSVGVPRYGSEAPRNVEANPDEALRQHVEAEASEEFLGAERHQSELTAVTVVLPPKRHVVVGDGHESMIRDRDSMRVPGQIVIYFAQRTDQGYSFQILNLATGHIRTFGSTPRGISNGATVSPDGRWFAYTQQDHAGSDIVVVRNFK
jgi:hypothetical protein